MRNQSNMSVKLSESKKKTNKNYLIKNDFNYLSC